MSDLVIPNGPVPPSRRNPQTAIYYSQPKAGKTTSVAALAGVLILELEPAGADFIAARKVDIPDMPTLLKMLDQLTALRVAGKPACRRLAIDTIDVVEDWCDPAALEEYTSSVLGKDFKGTSIVELPMGAGYGRLRDKMSEMLWRFSQAAEEVILLAHVRDRMITKTSGEVSALDVDLTGKVRNICCSRASAVGFMRRDAQDNLLVTFRTSESVNCGSRCAHLAGREFVIGRKGTNGEPVFDWSSVYIEDTPKPT